MKTENFFILKDILAIFIVNHLIKHNKNDKDNEKIVEEEGVVKNSKNKKVFQV